MCKEDRPLCDRGSCVCVPNVQMTIVQGGERLRVCDEDVTFPVSLRIFED